MSLKTRLLAAALTAAFAAGCAGGQKKPPVEASATITEEETPASEQGGGQPAAAPAPVTFQPIGEPGKFTVPFPQQVEPKRNAMATASGEQIQVAGWTANVGGVAYSINVQDYPLSLVEANPPGAFLNQGRKDVVDYLKGTVGAEEPADLTAGTNSYPGRSFTATSPSGDIKGRVYLVGQRLYTLFTLAPAGTDTTQADQFLNGLTLENPPAPVPVKKKTKTGTTPGGGTTGGGTTGGTAPTTPPTGG